MTSMHLYRWVLPIVLLSLVSACGFKLRGEAATLPPAWERIAIEFGGSLSAHNGLVEALERRLQESHGVRIEADPAARVPRIVLIDERFNSPVSALDTLGRATEYLLEYVVRFRFVDANGKSLSEVNRIYLRSEQSYSSAKILAKQRETEELQQSLRETAADRIIERLAGVARQS